MGTTLNRIGLAIVAAYLGVVPAAAGQDAPDAAELSERLSDRPPESHRATVLTRQAVALIRQREWEHAESVLTEALALSPDDPINLYNLACVNAQRGEVPNAVECLERAAAAGFSDFALISRDPDLAPARASPRYRAFVQAKDQWQRRAAERVVAGLRARFGQRYAYGIDPDQKLIFATDVDEDTLADLKDTLAAQARGLARDLFAGKPEAYVSVVVPSASDYRKIMRFHNVGGAYFDATKTLVAQKPGDVMRHEFTHALHAADRAPRGQEHAAWVVEGLGVLYESSEKLSTEEGDVIVPLADNARLPVAAAAARRKSLVPLARFLAMSPGEFLQRPNITYAQAGSLMLFLLDRGQLRKFYDAYKQTWGADPTGRVALERTSGMATGEFEEAWTRWLADRPPEPFFGAPALFLGARVAPARGGMTVIAVAPNGPAAEAGIEPRDLILRVNGKAVADYASLRPALGPYKPGRTIVLHVRRGTEAWDVPVKFANVASAPAQMAPQQ